MTCGRTRYILHHLWDTFYKMHFKFKYQTRFMDLIYIYTYIHKFDRKGRLVYCYEKYYS